MLVCEALERFHSYFALTRIARCGFLWGKTTKTSFASGYTHCETALAAQEKRLSAAMGQVDGNT
jgi:hypothetical protein